jgi:hypothetical protein
VTRDCDHYREREARSLGLTSMRTRKTVLFQNALKREMFVPEKYVAKIREELVDSLEDLVQKRLREVEGGFA